MKDWILNLLAGRLAAILAPPLLLAIGGLVAWVGSNVPWLAPYVTTESCLLCAATILGIGMSFINYLTTARAFKYAAPLQRFLRIMAKGLGVELPKVDGVAASGTVAVTAQLAAKVDQQETRKVPVPRAVARRAPSLLRANPKTR